VKRKTTATTDIKLNTETKTIGDLEVTVTAFLPIPAMELQARLLKIVGPALGMLGKVTMDSDVKELGPLIGTALMNVQPGELPALVRDVLKSTSVVYRGKNLTLDKIDTINIVFAGRLRAMYEVIGFTLMVNFSDFFEDGLDDRSASELMSEETE